MHELSLRICGAVQTHLQNFICEERGDSFAEISCSHISPEGSVSALVGRHGAMNPAGSERNMAANIDALRQNASRAGAFRAIGAVPCVPSNQESPSRGSLGLPWSPLINPAVRMPSRNQSFCSQLWFCRSRSWGGRHGQADQRVAAADLHGRVHRERHIRRNAAPLSRRANLVRAGASFDGIAFAVQAARPFRGASGKAAAGNGPAVCRFRPHRRPQPVDHDASSPGPRVVCPTSDSWRIKFAFNQPWRPRLGERRPRVRSISRSRTSITRAPKPARIAASRGSTAAKISRP